VFTGPPEPHLIYLERQPERALWLSLFFKYKLDGIKDGVDHGYVEVPITNFGTESLVSN
jgi:hypothetical protein